MRFGKHSHYKMRKGTDQQEFMILLWQEHSDKLPYIPSIRGYVILYDAFQLGVVSLRYALKKARDFAKSLEGKVIGSVDVLQANTMTLPHYIKAARELRGIYDQNSAIDRLDRLLDTKLALLDTSLKLRRAHGDNTVGKVFAGVYEHDKMQSSIMIQGVDDIVAEFDPKTYVPILAGSDGVPANDFYFYIGSLNGFKVSRRAVIGVRYKGIDVIHAGYPLDAEVTINPNIKIDGIVIPIVLYADTTSASLADKRGH